MVNFGKKLKETQIQEWQGYYINYKMLKKKVKQYSQQIEAGAQDPFYILKDFSRTLDNQVLYLYAEDYSYLIPGLLASEYCVSPNEMHFPISKAKRLCLALGNKIERIVLFFLEQQGILTGSVPSDPSPVS
ncbi:hypothetical protein RHMOL_Rhmol07G0024100 [Rhododendron molle]|uniref:Uncharacterized protein n=1 Tax=Rhododendron molle TaxID=49168 RepID=A0ACC0MWD0_RHOML|nr:hypothetical protein RHMOL_Rhmol07G0024100 [Rhododendron molle]